MRVNFPSVEMPFKFTEPVDVMAFTHGRKDPTTTTSAPAMTIHFHGETELAPLSLFRTSVLVVLIHSLLLRSLDCLLGPRNLAGPHTVPTVRRPCPGDAQNTPGHDHWRRHRPSFSSNKIGYAPVGTSSAIAGMLSDSMAASPSFPIHWSFLLIQRYKRMPTPTTNQIPSMIGAK